MIEGGLSKKPTLWVIDGAFVTEPYLGGMKLGELSSVDVAGYDLVHYTQVELHKMCEDFFAEHRHYYHDTPIESYPGYIGHTWDGEGHLGPELSPLESVNWRDYFDLLDEQDSNGQIFVDYGLNHIVLDLMSFRETGDLAHILDQLPTVSVYRDPGNPDGGPASGSGYIFFTADGVTTEELQSSVSALVAAVKANLSSLKGDA